MNEAKQGEETTTNAAKASMEKSNETKLKTVLTKIFFI